MSDETDIATRDASTGRFLAGGKGGPGRKPGSRNRLSSDLLTAFADDFERHGRSVIERVRTESPAIYLKLAVDMLPRHLDVDVDVDVKLDAANFRTRFEEAIYLLGNEPRRVKVIDGP